MEDCIPFAVNAETVHVSIGSEIFNFHFVIKSSQKLKFKMISKVESLLI